MSIFWQRLGAEHAAELEVHGVEDVKRTQALRYFTWRWSPRRILGGEQGRYLLRHTSPWTWLRAVLTPVDLRGWEPVRWSLVERWLYAIACRLLWEVARKRGAPAVLALEEPELGRPFPVRWRGRLISQDLANSALEAATILEALDGARPRHIVEIGAGYGRTAFVLLSLFPEAAYTVIDIPPSLDIGRWYLRTLFPGRRLTFLEANQAGQLEPYDLALTISSLAEMRPEDAAGYLALLATRGRPGATVYLKQWARWWNPDDHVEMAAAGYRLPWPLVMSRPAAVQTSFVEMAWRKAV